MRVVFAGTPHVAVPTLQALSETEHLIVGVVSRPDAPVGRRRVLTPSPVSAWALENDVNLLRTSRITADDAAVVRAWAADIGVVVAYGALLDPDALALPSRGWINLHFSALPRWRGAAPVQHALLAGDTTIDTCVMMLDVGLDTGPVLSRVTHAIDPDETAAELLARLAESGAQQVIQVLDAFDNFRPVTQDGEATLAPKLSAETGRLRSDETSGDAYNRFRAVTTEPGAFVVTERGRLKILAARENPQASVAPGTISPFSGDVVLGLTHGGLSLLTVQPAGGKVMAALDWIRGVPGASVKMVDE